MENIINIAQEAYKLSPLNKFRELKGLQDKVNLFTILEKINLMVYSFKRYDRSFNYELCLFIPSIWNDFERSHWEDLIRKMFPRELKNEEEIFKQINTGEYFDICLLNGIIGVSPFKFIFDTLEISAAEKTQFYSYLKKTGEHGFYTNERDLIENIVNFYNLNVFESIVKVKERLINEGMEPTVPYESLLTSYNHYSSEV